MKTLVLAFNLNLILLISFFSSFSQSYPANFSDIEIASGILNPTVMTFAPDGRIFVCQQDGALIVIKNNVKLPTPALQLSVNTNGERGLVGITLHPSFSTNGFIYLYYTLADGSRNRVSRFTMIGDVINPTTELILINLDKLSPTSPFHNGGAMLFKGDKLYIAVGENSTGANAQNLDTHKGKLLRVNADASIPTDNPFYLATNTPQRNSVWAYGLRNPFTIDLDPVSGRIFVNDVGQVTWEEINDATEKGKNFGWPSTEGATTNPAFTSPVYAYKHGSGDGLGCAITGGTLFNPPTTNYPSTYRGKYFFQDYCNAWINYMDPNAATPVRVPFGTGVAGQMLGLDVGLDGNLYFLTRAGKLLKIIYKTTQPPLITDQPDPVTVSLGQPASFHVSATGALPLAYQWKKNNVNIAGATTSSYAIMIVQASDIGNYSVTVTNSFGSVNSNTVALTTNVNTLPTPVITTPMAGALYRAGETISFSGTGSDPEDGTLPASAFRWSVGFHHDTHVHDGPPIAVGVQSGSYVIPQSGESSINVYYRLTLTVTDSQGLSSSTFVDIKPQTSYISLRTNPPGLKLNLDDEPFITPYNPKRVEGIQVTIDANLLQDQMLNGEIHHFEGWAHGGAPAQSFPTPIDNTTYTGNFSKVLSAPWRTTEIGKLNVIGNASVTDGTFSLTASGADIWGTADHFRFVYQKIFGNTILIARVTGVTNTNAWTKAGLMIRSSIHPASSHASIFITPTSGVTFQRRTTTEGTSFATNGAAAVPSWIRLERSGNTFSAHSSTNGTSWTAIGTPVMISMSSTIYVGLALTSHNSSTLGTATFTNVSVTGTPVAGASVEEERVVFEREKDQLDLYPNPVNGNSLMVRLRDEREVAEAIQIVNPLGQVVVEKSMGDADPYVDITKVSRGLNFVKVKTARKTITKGFIRE
jgi:glucose/arabinose dehydrogenase